MELNPPRKLSVMLTDIEACCCVAACKIAFISLPLCLACLAAYIRWTLAITVLDAACPPLNQFLQTQLFAVQWQTASLP